MTRSRRLFALALVCACSSAPGSGEGDVGGSVQPTNTGTSSGTGTGEDSADEGGDDEGLTGQGYVPDSGGNSCGQECDIWQEGSCPEGQKCTAAGCLIGSNPWDTHLCREIQGDAQLGDACEYTDGSGVSGNDTCAEGFFCWDADAQTGLGTCVAFCTGSEDEPVCAQGSRCVFIGYGILPICLPLCDPLEDDCGPEEMCVADNSGFGCAPDASQGMAPYGSPCQYLNGCNAGLMCVESARVPEASCEGGEGCCTPFCNLLDPEPCPGAGQVCELVHDPPYPGLEHVGVCLLPP